MVVVVVVAMASAFEEACLVGNPFPMLLLDEK
jgi:hypothetical protein